MGDRITRPKPFGEGRGLLRHSRPAGWGADVQAIEAVRVKKGPLYGRIPGDNRDLGAGRGWKSGGRRARDGKHKLDPGTPCGHPARYGSLDKWRRLAGWGAAQVNGCSTPVEVRGGKRVQQEIEAALTGGTQGINRSQVLKE